MLNLTTQRESSARALLPVDRFQAVATHIDGRHQNDCVKGLCKAI